MTSYCVKIWIGGDNDDETRAVPVIRVLVRWPHLEGHGYSYGLVGWTGQGKKFLFDDGIYIVESVTQWMEIPE